MKFSRQQVARRIAIRNSIAKRTSGPTMSVTMRHRTPVAANENDPVLAACLDAAGFADHHDSYC